MKKLFFILVAALAFACNDTSAIDELNVENQSVVANEPIGTVVSEDAIVEGEELSTSLIFMREEEKLARDVYLTFYELFEAEIFENIAASEQKHTDAIQQLITLYGFTDPVTEDVRGVFQNKDLQELYDLLIEQGSGSLVDALEVGALIEEVDIKDLNDAEVYITDDEVLLVYNNLLKGSRNHLRAFAGQLELLGETYYAQILDDEYFTDIVNSEMETGGMMSGDGLGNGSQHGYGMGKGNNREGDGSQPKDGSCNNG